MYKNLHFRKLKLAATKSASPSGINGITLLYLIPEGILVKELFFKIMKYFIRLKGYEKSMLIINQLEEIKRLLHGLVNSLT